MCVFGVSGCVCTKKQIKGIGHTCVLRQYGACEVPVLGLLCCGLARVLIVWCRTCSGTTLFKCGNLCLQLWLWD